MNDTSRVQGEIESPRPLRARAGLVEITGWCVLEGATAAPPVRLATAAGILPVSKRIPRSDTPVQAAPAEPGFVIAGRLPAGTHVARFEAQLPDGRWQCFKTLSLVVEPPPFAVGIESPAAVGPVHRRVYVEGWAFHPEHEMRELALRYGHQQIACDRDRARTDLPAAYPGSPHAGNAGFKSRVILSAGRGPLRLKAKLADGSTRIARTALTVEIDEDENHRPELTLTAPRIPLESGVAHELPAANQTGRPLNILFVSHGDFTANSTLQIAALAHELARAGHACAVGVPQDLATLTYHRTPRFSGLLHADAIATGGSFANGRGPDVIHAWTTRESVRTTSLSLQARFGSRLVVQLEDNEQEIRNQRTAARVAPGDVTDPAKGRDFLQAADGVTLIVDSLRAFVPAGKPTVTLWPAADARYFYPRPVPAAFRAALQIPPDATVLFYPGNLHASNAREMQALYGSVARLNDAGHRTFLIRAGAGPLDLLGSLAEQTRPHVLDLGPIHTHRHLPPLMALADILVQPGEPDAFNNFRFPSKLPEFFALGRPVILPRTNLGTQLRHGIDAWVLDRADAAGIADAVLTLRRDAALSERLSQGALAFATRHFSWQRAAEALAKFYATLAPS